MTHPHFHQCLAATMPNADVERTADLGRIEQDQIVTDEQQNDHSRNGSDSQKDQHSYRLESSDEVRSPSQPPQPPPPPPGMYQQPYPGGPAGPGAGMYQQQFPGPGPRAGAGAPMRPTGPVFPGYGMPVRESRGPRGSAVVGWTLTIIGALIMIGLHHFSGAMAETLEETEEQSADTGVLMMNLQGKFILGGLALQQGEPGMLYTSARDSLNLGSVAQRQRYAILAAELRGPDAAQETLEEIDSLVREESAGRDSKQMAKVGELLDIDGVITGPQSATQNLLHQIYDVEDNDWSAVAANVAELSERDREIIKSELGWYGDLALSPRATAQFSDPEQDPQQRTSMINHARMMTIIVVAVVVLLGLLAAAGFIGIIVLVVMTLTGKIRAGFAPGRVHHGIYAETFGIWMLSFPIMQVAAGLAAFVSKDLIMPATFAAFFASLAALFWPVIRGASWRDVRNDIGWTLGKNPLAQPLFGVAGYAMALPLLGVGIAITFALMQIQLMFLPESSPLTPSGGPAHPIIFELGGDSIWPKLMILALAAIAAPIVEETMFRGVLYRHLRDASHMLGFILSVILSGLLSSFVFAAIHPQGWVAIPALMSLALAFALLREWRGSVVPSMCVHAISNFLVMSLLIFMMSS